MKITAFVVLTCGLLIGLLFLYQWGAKKLGLDPKPQQPAPPLTPYDLYAEHRVIYEEMAHCLRDCLASVGRICYLNCPRNVQELYAAQVADRVKRLNGRIIFCYEVERTGVQTRLNKPSVYSNTCAQIAAILKSNLPAYLMPGLSFSDIHVFDIGNDYVRVVIENVNKVVNCNTCYTGGNYGGCAWDGNYIGEEWYY